MSDAGIFAVGLLVTLVVGTAMAMLIWAAIQDGWAQREFVEAQRVQTRGEAGDRQAADVGWPR